MTAHKKHFPWTRRLVRNNFILPAVIAAGITLVLITFYFANLDLKEDLISKAEAAARIIEPRILPALTGGIGDRHSPVYLSLKKQLQKVSSPGTYNLYNFTFKVKHCN